MKTSEVLRTAADLIENNGWARGYGWPGEAAGQRYCLEGGIMAALGGNYMDHVQDSDVYEEFQKCPAYKAVQDFISEADGKAWTASLWTWNDREAVTSNDVLRTLRNAAARIEGTDLDVDMEPLPQKEAVA